MKTPLLIVLLIALTQFANAQKSASRNIITQGSDGLYYMHYDSSGAKSTIIEFDRFLVMMEVPVRDEGGGARVLREHEAEGAKAIRTLTDRFPKKPLKYVIHSHWHPHSLSSVKPFLENGTTLISTRSNFARIREFVDSATVLRFRKQIQFVDSDSLVIRESGNAIVIHRFLKQDFPNTPTTEYLFFYLPRYKALHSGCMYNRWEGQPVAGKEILTGREEDVNRFLITHRLAPEFFIRLNNDKGYTRQMIGYSTFANVITGGIRISDINQQYLGLDVNVLERKRDSLIQEVITQNIPPTIFNSGVYEALRQKDLRRALVLAQYQVLINPSDPNVWDTLGEVHYFSGNVVVARAYEQQSRKIAPGYSQGGEAIWKTDLEEYKKKWK